MGHSGTCPLGRNVRQKSVYKHNFAAPTLLPLTSSSIRCPPTPVIVSYVFLAVCMWIWRLRLSRRLFSSTQPKTRLSLFSFMVASTSTSFARCAFDINLSFVFHLQTCKK